MVVNGSLPIPAPHSDPAPCPDAPHRSSSSSNLLNSESYKITGQAPRRLLAEQVWTADRANKQRVAGEKPRRLVGLVYQDRDVLRRVSRGVQELE